MVAGAAAVVVGAWGIATWVLPASNGALGVDHGGYEICIPAKAGTEALFGLPLRNWSSKDVVVESVRFGGHNLADVQVLVDPGAVGNTTIVGAGYLPGSGSMPEFATAMARALPPGDATIGAGATGALLISPIPAQAADPAVVDSVEILYRGGGRSWVLRSTGIHVVSTTGGCSDDEDDDL